MHDDVTPLPPYQQDQNVFLHPASPTVAQMQDPTNLPCRKSRKLKKTSTHSPYFPIPRRGATKSPYFKQSSRRGKGVRSVAQTTTPNVPHRNRSTFTHILELAIGQKVENPLITEEARFLDRIVNDGDDGWMTERESRYHRTSPKTHRKPRNHRERKNKIDIGGSAKHANPQKLDGSPEIATGINDNRALIETNSTMSQNERYPDLETTEVRRHSTTEKAKKGKRKKERKQALETSTTGMPIEVGKPSHETPKPSKRKRAYTIENVIENPSESSFVPALDPNPKVPVALPESKHKKTDGNRRKRAKKTYQNSVLQYDTLRDDTLQQRATTSDVDVPQVANTPKPETSPKTIVNNQAIKKSREKGLLSQTGNSQPARNGPKGVTLLAKSRKKQAPPTQPNSIPLQGIIVPDFSTPIVGELTESCPGETEQVRDSAINAHTKPPRKRTRTKIRKTGKVSSYFASSAVEQDPGKLGKSKNKNTKKRVPAGTSVIPWPPLTAETFGLIQEELRNNSFHVIISTIFLNKTRGVTAVPLLRRFLVDYPTPLALSQGDLQTITDFLQPLGLHRTRADRLIKLGKRWLEEPPTLGKGAKKYNYPVRDTKPFNIPSPPSEVGERPKLGVEQNCEWEVAHLPGVGAYALDSWRIFCLDEFRKGSLETKVTEGVGEGAYEGQLNNYENEEWRRVVPKDKELRAYLRWRWAKEGVKWREAGDLEVEVESEIGREYVVIED